MAAALEGHGDTIPSTEGQEMSQALDITIARLEALPSDHLAEIVAESEQAGFRFVRRLVQEWEDGTSRFSQPGEAFFAALCGARVVGVCGLTRDPYASSPNVGRVRRLYVLSALRRRGVGRRLVQAVLAAARGVFTSLRLRTETEAAARLYTALGFRACVGIPDCTHEMELGQGLASSSVVVSPLLCEERGSASRG
jgi:GNAT superfamily N-acetyltransferase